ncbi:hypothetical protein M0Q03_03825, partial [bacterium]|nr:hypothetical protein [bacterium]
MQKKLMLITGLVASSLILSATAIAASDTNNNKEQNSNFHQQRNNRGTMGTITSINGNTFTITTRERGDETET